MRLPSFAYPENLKVQDDPAPEPIPDDVPLDQLAEQVVRGKVKLGREQLRMLIELLPYLQQCRNWLPKCQRLCLALGAGSRTQQSRNADRSPGG